MMISLSGCQAVESQRKAVLLWSQLWSQTPHTWESWTWVTMTWRIQEWSCSLLDWGIPTVNWRFWDQYSCSWSTSDHCLPDTHSPHHMCFDSEAYSFKFALCSSLLNCVCVFVCPLCVCVCVRLSIVCVFCVCPVYVFASVSLNEHTDTQTN
jgi:hypothetical protein